MSEMEATARTLEALYAAGHRLAGQDRHRDALSLFHAMLLVDPRDERGWLALASCHQELDEPEKAIALCELASSACEGKALRCAVALARLHKARGADDEAAAAYEGAARVAELLDEPEMAALIAQEAAS
ncbi:MAG: tetratricopeptide repeat protein [Labilithrix sp.]|nr:tetratricopeptide repeat protein [Labilithrix sp.]